MRTHGTLTKWNDDRGFGFISPAQGNDEIFVHISAFPRGDRPHVNEFISFETETGQNGKLRAVRIMRPGQRRAPHRPRIVRQSERPASLINAVLGILAIAAIAAYGYSSLTGSRSAPAVSVAPVTAASSSLSTSFKCDGRTTCSQMTSCAEATYFLQHCPNTKMDGNDDGEPCEQQWCN